MDRSSLVVTWVIRGLNYGYPDCCIGEFVAVALSGREAALARGKRQFDGTGYVPCAKCNKRTNKELLDAINVRRDHAEHDLFPKG